MALLWGLAGAALAHWAQDHGWLARSAWWPVFAVITWTFAAWRMASPMQGRLRWDGAHWVHLPNQLPQAIALKNLRISVDLGGWLLLRADHGRWCGLTAGKCGAQWHGLQLALRNPVAQVAGEAPR